ncbi:DUF4232 domain-containing protein [Streptomyces venezuelae]|uniref:DUF4232 domain-containing protein n=1 Tax=Streptomyces venezuelae TaxID=54571 RepID=UPI003797B044
MSSHTQIHRVAQAAVWAAAAALAAPASLLAAAGPAAAASPVCRADQLQASWSDKGTAGSDDPTGEQETAVVSLRNSGSGTCTLKGHPHVVLQQGKSTETVRESGEPAPKLVSLDAGKSTTFTLAFLSEKDEPKQAIAPTTMSVTPPDSKDSLSLPWKWGPVTKQESATHPGNFVGPVGATLSNSMNEGGAWKADCGSGKGGLHAVAITSQGQSACPTALKVRDAWAKAPDAEKGKPKTVTVDGTDWKCREKQGDPNPYQECVNTKEPTEKVQLFS